MKKTGYTLLRLAMGINFLFHAINRYYYGINGFSKWMVTEFEPTFFPSALVNLFANILPIIEALVGLSLIIGLKTKWSLIIGSLTITFLIAGSCMINKWDWVGLQMVYAICFYLLSENYEFNRDSLDNRMKK